MLTSEYAVLDGAMCIGLPTKLGQKMKVSPSRGSDLIWHSYDVHGERWFEAQISLYDFSPVKTNDEEKAKKLGKILKNAVRLNSEFLDKWNGFKVENTLEFPTLWGLGSSSTLMYNIAQWADINAFFLHFKVSNGSGYDIACAGADAPICYELKDDQLHYEEVDFDPNFKDKLYFVYLGKKQSSEEGVKHYLKNVKGKKILAQKINEVSNAILKCKTLARFEQLIDQHESILSEALNLPMVKNELFSDYWGHIKSLGAWGGDFVLATSEEPPPKTIKYFNDKGYSDVLSYKDIIV